MGLLLFKKVFFADIVSGRKTTTLRRWDRPRCSPGQRVFTPGVGYLRIRSIAPITLAALSPADARADGFPTLRALRQTLRALYDPRLRRRTLWRITFTYESPPPSAPHRSAPPRSALAPIETSATTSPAPRA